MIKNDYKAKSIECNDCSDLCEIIEITSNGEVLARWGDRCGKWSNIKKHSEEVG